MGCYLSRSRVIFSSLELNKFVAGAYDVELRICLGEICVKCLNLDVFLLALQSLGFRVCIHEIHVSLRPRYLDQFGQGLLKHQDKTGLELLKS